MTAIRGGSRWYDGAAAALTALALYASLAQGTFYKVDGFVLLDRLLRGDVEHEYHTFYLRFVRHAFAALAPVGFSLHATAVLVSSVGTAVGVWFFHRSAVGLGLSRQLALQVTLGVAVTPALVFFATIAEVHGAFLPFAGLATLALVRCSRTQRWRDVACAGLALALAYLAHPFGALIGAELPLLWWLQRRTNGAGPRAVWSGFLPRAALVTTILAAGVLLLPVLWRAWFSSTGGASYAMRMWLNYGTGRLLDPVATLRTLGNEWLVPGLPWTVVAGVLLLGSRLRTGAWLLLVAVLPYAFAAQMMLEGYTERGAYVLPVLWPTVCLAVLATAHVRLLLPALLVLSAGLAIAQVKLHDEPVRAASFAAGVRALAGERPIFLIEGHCRDLEARVMHLPTVEHLYLGWELGLPADATRQSIARCRAGFAALKGKGACILLSEATRAGLERAVASGSFELSVDPRFSPPAPAAAQWLDFLIHENRARRRTAAGFEGWELDPP